MEGAWKKRINHWQIFYFFLYSIGTTKSKELHHQKIKRPVTPIRLSNATFDSGRNYIAAAGNFGGGRNNNPPDLAPINQQHICELYSDTLDQCFDKSGLYVCKSYGPRCYIIQKVISTNKNFRFDIKITHNQSLGWPKSSTNRGQETNRIFWNSNPWRKAFEKSSHNRRSRGLGDLGIISWQVHFFQNKTKPCTYLHQVQQS